jgi:pimeloyl-ACP methyl ester carboxylesterase
LRLPDEFGADDLLPVAFDGEDYLPVGYASSPGTVDVVRVPRAVAGDQGTPTPRGIGRAIRLFIFKKLGRHMREIGLRYVENKNAAVKYSEVKKDRFQPGDRIAVFVHGFLSDTSWMARDIAPFLRNQVLPYEHALAWDYESFGASVETNGTDLATALRQQCGCGPNDGLIVHVYAHSVGSLVARCLVELSNGHEFVDRLILAGPPNRGTTLATLSRGFFYLLSALMNNIAAVPFAGAADWLVKQLYEQGVGWQDLAVDSDITKRLNTLETPSRVPYLVLAGTNALNQAQGDRLNRLAQKMLDRTLDLIFGETENDAVIGMSSLKAVRHGAYSALTVKSLSCDHFSYFATAESQAAIQQWMLN